MEAGSLQSAQQNFRVETGLPFTFVFALYENGSHQPPNAQDVKIYAQQLGITQFPVLADGVGAFANATPMTQSTHPEVCAVAPDMTLISCGSGHKSYLQRLQDIKSHAAKMGP